MSVLVALTMAGLLSAPPAVPAEYILGHEGVRWFRLDIKSGARQPLPALNELNPLEAAITKDGERIVFISRAPEARLERLYALESGEPSSAAREIGNPFGRHAEPAFGPDGERVFFAHHPMGDGPPGAHSKSANAQIYVCGAPKSERLGQHVIT